MKARVWSLEDAEKLKTVYSNHTQEQLAEMFPQYTNNQIRRKAQMMGIKKSPELAKHTRLKNSMANRKDIWPDEEKKIVIDLYPTKGWEGVQELLPHRTQEMIKKVANRMGLNRLDTNTMWEQTEIIVDDEDIFSITVKYRGY